MEMLTPYFFRRVLMDSVTTLREDLHLKLPCGQKVDVSENCVFLHLGK